ncbi:MAG: DNA-binding protein [Clostridia bacterium]|nr:DNA-binding protein [Clostridia bacterium]
MRRIEYERLFADYPDVVTLPVFRKMLGGIGDGTARKLMWENRVEHFMVRTTYYIPKEKVIDYLLSPHYRSYKKKLHHRIE